MTPEEQLLENMKGFFMGWSAVIIMLIIFKLLGII